jgi:hypothetical protein
MQKRMGVGFIYKYEEIPLEVSFYVHERELYIDNDLIYTFEVYDIWYEDQLKKLIPIISNRINDVYKFKDDILSYNIILLARMNLIGIRFYELDVFKSFYSIYLNQDELEYIMDYIDYKIPRIAHMEYIALYKEGDYINTFYNLMDSLYEEKKLYEFEYKSNKYIIKIIYIS